MKYVVVLGDGMADEPIESLGGKTPLEYANTPMMDMLAKRGEIGLAKTVPDGMKPGSDVANLAVLGYNPKQYYSGRSPLEALSIGVNLLDTDIAMRTNIVTLSDDDLPYEQKTMIDHSSSEISTEDAKILVDALKKEFDNDEFKLYLGTSYRHLLIWDKGVVEDFAQPHDILERVIGDYLPKDEKFLNMMKRSYDILNNHPLNVERAKKGLHKANSMWFWGAGTKPMVDSFEEKFNKKGVMISAVDLLKGIAVGAGMKVAIVEGADGTLNTNYVGKANAAADSLLKEGYDFAYIHVEAPDEMGHQGSLERKLKAIENLDSKVIKTIYDRLAESGEDFRILIMPDHPTPIRIRTHSSNPVPYLLFDSTKETLYNHTYSEKEALESGNMVQLGYKTIEKLFEE